MTTHNLKGNCWNSAADLYDERGYMIDVCTEHDEPRGECSECPACTACDKEADPMEGFDSSDEL